MRHPIRSAPVLALACAIVLGGCGDGSTAAPEGNAAFTVEVSGEHFTVEVATAAQTNELQGRLDTGTVGVITGSLVEGDGGFNEPWSWHLDPSTVHAVDASIELCDGRPSMVEENLSYWLGTVGTFCPWGARVTARVR